MRWSILLAAIALSARAGAQTDAYDPNRYMTQKEIRSAYSSISKFLEPDQSPISVADARRFTASVVLSTLAKKCGLSWDATIYLPMMAHFRHSKRFNERQMTALGVMHGIHQSFLMDELPAGACPPKVREEISRAMSRHP